MVQRLVEQRVAIVPGSMFWADAGARADKRACPYFRLTFASHADEVVREGFRRLGVALRGN